MSALPQKNPDFLADEFCQSAHCTDKSHNFLQCRGPNCSKKIHLGCTGFPRGALKKDTDGSKLDLQWYCTVCKSSFDSVMRQTHDVNEKIAEALSSLTGRLQNNTSALDVTANHVDDLTDSVKDIMTGIQESLINLQSPKGVKEIEHFLQGPMTDQLTSLEESITKSVSDKIDKMTMELEGRLNKMLDNFTAQFCIYFGDLAGVKDQVREVKALSEKVIDLSDNLDSLRDDLTVTGDNKVQPPTPDSPINQELADVEKRIDQILNKAPDGTPVVVTPKEVKKPDVKTPKKKRPAPQPPVKPIQLAEECRIVISNLAPNTKVGNLKAHVAEVAKVDIESIHLKKITPKNLSKPKYIKFIVTAPLDSAAAICDVKAWDEGLIVKNVSAKLDKPVPAQSAAIKAAVRQVNGESNSGRAKTGAAKTKPHQAATTQSAEKKCAILPKNGTKTRLRAANAVSSAVTSQPILPSEASLQLTSVNNARSSPDVSPVAVLPHHMHSPSAPSFLWGGFPRQMLDPWRFQTMSMMPPMMPSMFPTPPAWYPANIQTSPLEGPCSQ